MDILLNPIVISVVLMCGLCLVRMNVLLAIIVSAVVGGLLAGMDLATTMSIFISTMGGNAETALSYVLLGVMAAGMGCTGLTDILAVKIISMVKGNKIALMLVFTFVAILSGTLIPIHIAFIPILIPALLPMMDRLKIDRRQAACALSFGLLAPYITMPVGYGIIFQGIVSEQMTLNGMNVTGPDVVNANWILAVGMLIGLIVSLIYYNKPREYRLREADAEAALTDMSADDLKLKPVHYYALGAAVAAVLVQLKTGSMPLGAMVGVVIMLVSQVIKWKEMDSIFDEGVKLMGFISFVMLAASGYGGVISESGAVDTLINSAVAVVGTNKLSAAIVMLLVGLLIDMGIGTSFGTVPIIAVLFVPFAQQVGFSIPATIVIISAAAALGDAGSPASDTTLGPTAGLSVDGQHDHIWDTCVPTFVFYNTPLFICGILGALMF
jgi:predicted histidine transporter YuiF (NhaC family)